MELLEWFVKYIEVGVGLQRDCSQRAPSDELDSHGGRVFLPIVEDDEDQKWIRMMAWVVLMVGDINNHCY